MTIFNKIIALDLLICYYFQGDYMRFRKIKNLEKRRESCTDYRIPYKKIEDLDLKNLEKNYSPIDLSTVFSKEQPLVLEIGCGKGQFAAEYAKRHPDKNIIGVECVPGVLVKACEKVRDAELDNVRFLEMKAEYLPVFIEKKSVCEIYLNFSTPFPKYKKEKHRLTSPDFLKIYKQLLKNDGFIAQKTDNEPFFDYSAESFTANGFELSEVSRDLHNSGFKDNIFTEYEEKFASQGLPIYRLVAKLKK